MYVVTDAVNKEFGVSHESVSWFDYACMCGQREKPTTVLSDLARAPDDLLLIKLHNRSAGMDV